LLTLLDHLPAGIHDRVDGRTPLVDGGDGSLLALLHRLARPRGRSRSIALRVARAVAKVASRLVSTGWRKQERAGRAGRSAQLEHEQGTTGIGLLLKWHHGS